jgi:hypothetical protein
VHERNFDVAAAIYTVSSCKLLKFAAVQVGQKGRVSQAGCERRGDDQLLRRKIENACERK